VAREWEVSKGWAHDPASRAKAFTGNTALHPFAALFVSLLAANSLCDPVELNSYSSAIRLSCSCALHAKQLRTCSVFPDFTFALEPAVSVARGSVSERLHLSARYVGVTVKFSLPASAHHATTYSSQFHSLPQVIRP
jgi:hypothetical protein